VTTPFAAFIKGVHPALIVQHEPEFFPIRFVQFRDDCDEHVVLAFFKQRAAQVVRPAWLASARRPVEIC